MGTEVMWQELRVYLFISNSYARYFYVSGPALGTGDIVVNKKEKGSALRELMFY